MKKFRNYSSNFALAVVLMSSCAHQNTSQQAGSNLTSQSQPILDDSQLSVQRELWSVSKWAFKTALIVLTAPERRLEFQAQANTYIGQIDTIADEAERKPALYEGLSHRISETILDLRFIVEDTDMLSLRASQHKLAEDPTYLALVESNLEKVSVEETPPSVAVEKHKKPKDGTITPKEAGTIIITKYEEYLPRKMRNEFKAHRNTQYLDDADFLNLPYCKPAPSKCRHVNAMTDKKVGKIYINKLKQNKATALHEAFHLYASDKFRLAVGFAFNEGTTEFLTRKVTAPRSISRLYIYDGSLEVISGLIELLNKKENALLSAYFLGNVPALEAFTDKALGVGFFDKLTKAMKLSDCLDDDCSVAQKLIQDAKNAKSRVAVNEKGQGTL